MEVERKTEGIIRWKEQVNGGRKKEERYYQMERTGKWRKEERGMVLDERKLWYYKNKKSFLPTCKSCPCKPCMDITLE